MGVVWHGHYLRFFEYGREAWGKQYKFGYMDVYRAGYMIPVVDMDCRYRAPLQYGDVVEIRARFWVEGTAKMRFDYELRREADGQLVCTGSSTQVFIDAERRELQIALPEFFGDWLKAREHLFQEVIE